MRSSKTISTWAFSLVFAFSDFALARIDAGTLLLVSHWENDYSGEPFSTGSSSFSGFDAGDRLIMGPTPNHILLGTIRSMDENSIASIISDRRLISFGCDKNSLASSGVPTKGVFKQIAPNATSFSWALTRLKSRGGKYRLCWCSERDLDGIPSLCSEPHHFRALAGTLVVDGPFGFQTWECSASRLCEIAELRGYNLGLHDRVMIKQGDCIGGIAVMGFGFVSEAPYGLPYDNSSETFNWGNKAIAAAGGEFRVCWCTERNWALGVEPCIAFYQYRFSVDAGLLRIKGPKAAHAPYGMQFGSVGDDVPTGISIDYTDSTKGLMHAVISGWTTATIEDPYSARVVAEANGLTWSHGRAASDWITVPCCYLRFDEGDAVFCDNCTYPRLTLQPLDLRNYGGNDGWVIKMAYNGSRLWARQIASTAPAGEDKINAVSVSKGDLHIVVAGTTTGNFITTAPLLTVGLVSKPLSMNGMSDCFIARLTPDGELAGIAQFGSADVDYVTGIAVDKYGDIIVSSARFDAPSFAKPPQGGWDSLITKFGTDMSFKWAGLVGSFYDDIIVALVPYEGPDGIPRAVGVGRVNGYFFRTYYGTNRNWDILVVSYSGDIDPNRDWGTQFGSWSAGQEYATTVAVGPDGSFYIGGYTDSNLNFTWYEHEEDEPDDSWMRPGGWDSFVMKLLPGETSQMAPTWAWTHMMGTRIDEYTFSMAFVPSRDPRNGGDILISGTSETNWPESDVPTPIINEYDDLPNLTGHLDAWLITLSPVDGRRGSWYKQLSSPGNQNIVGIATDDQGGHVYVVGWTTSGFTPEPGAAPLTAYGGKDTFFLKLPWGRSAASCFRGTICLAGLSDGYNLGPQDRAVLTNRRCGRGSVNAQGIPNTISDGTVVVDTRDLRHENPGQTFVWGNKSEGRVLDAPVGRYVLCWCSESCETSYPMEVAVVNFVGPDGQQLKVCVTGEACDVTSILGREVSTWDRVAVMDACQGNLVPGFPRHSITDGIQLFESRNPLDQSCMTTKAEDMEGVTSNFGCERVTASAGYYRLCWCTLRVGGGNPNNGDGNATCTNPVEFSFDLGTLVVSGPRTLQNRRCVRGQRCLVESLIGIGLEAGDRLLVLHTCRIPVTPPYGPVKIQGVPGITKDAAAVALGANGSSFSISEQITAPPGNYSMCWCQPRASSGGCNSTDDFAALVGELEIVDPKRNHFRTCSRGLPCAIDDLEGVGLATGDCVYLMNFCPSAPVSIDSDNDVAPQGITVNTWPQGGLAYPAKNYGTSISWGPAAVWALAGRYALCWCVAPLPGAILHRCHFPQDFYVEIGELVLRGPVESQTFVGIAGHPLAFKYTAYGLQQKDGLAILPAGTTCSGSIHDLQAAASNLNFPNNGVLDAGEQPPTPPLGLPGNRTATVTYSYGREVIRANGGAYALCTLPSVGPSLLAGSLTILGPDAGQNFTVPAGWPVRLETSLEGEGLASGDMLYVVEASVSCGGSAGPRTAMVGGEGISFPSEDGKSFAWPGVAFVPGGDFNLCWCRDIFGSGHCRVPTNFVVNVGVLHVVGPMVEQWYSCTGARDCTIELMWSSGIGPQLGALAVMSGEDCSHAVLALGFSPPANGTSSFAWPRVQAPGGRQALCWCSPPWYNSDGCDDPANYIHQIGILEINGPFSNHSFVCLQGIECRVAPVRGVGVQDDSSMLFRVAGACGEPNPSGEVAMSSLAKSCGEYFVGCTYTWAANLMPLNPGSFKLCWAPSASSVAEDYCVEAGFLRVLLK